MRVSAGEMHFKTLNEQIRTTQEQEIIIEHCIGQRYIASGLSGKKIEIHGTPGNALGAYLNGADIVVYGNTQEATGDTMNAGHIYIYGSAGDATGYAMRGGKIFIEGSSGYRTGIHMKAYQEKKPVIVIGGSAGSFLGEYQAGGVIVVLGLESDGRAPVGNFCGTGMHGGKIFLRTQYLPKDLPRQISAERAEKADMEEIMEELREFSEVFQKDLQEILNSDFYVLRPNTKNPYKQLYTTN